MVIAEVKDVKKIYTTQANEIHALDGLSLSIEEGEFVAIVGASGSGKSTLLNVLGALDKPTSGEIVIRGVDIAGLSPDEQTIFRRRNIGFVFQQFNLIPVLNVYENIVLPMKLDGRPIDHEYTERLMSALGLLDKKERLTNTLSGGQQQRVAIARALITKPAIVLADEPTGSLDSRTGTEVISLMKILSEKMHQTLIVVTHSDTVAQMANRIIRIEDGKVCGGK